MICEFSGLEPSLIDSVLAGIVCIGDNKFQEE